MQTSLIYYTQDFIVSSGTVWKFAHCKEKVIKNDNDNDNDNNNANDIDTDNENEW